jgi:hypothetical protein
MSKNNNTTIFQTNGLSDFRNMDTIVDPSAKYEQQQHNVSSKWVMGFQAPRILSQHHLARARIQPAL